MSSSGSHTHTLKLHQHFQTNTLWLLLLLYTYTKLGRDFQLGCVETYKEVDKDHEDDGRDDSKVTDEHTSLQHRCHHRSITLYWDTDIINDQSLTPDVIIDQSLSTETQMKIILQIKS